MPEKLCEEISLFRQSKVMPFVFGLHIKTSRVGAKATIPML